ncbi:GDP-mannose 4,6-dehydratase [Nitrobacter hamburgensis]|nr:GDP-mannose 4,6-dehydratase [Nitrobacter hamburgensis]
MKPISRALNAISICNAAHNMTIRVLMTGSDGFVGPHIEKALRRICGAETEIVATSKAGGVHPQLGEMQALDVTDAAAVHATIARNDPTHVLHLAAIAAVGAASTDPGTAWAVHVGGTRNLAQALLDHAPRCWLLNVGSGLIYGETAKSGRLLDESAVPAPVDDYGVTKAAADLALGALVRRGLKVIRLRPFNHTGARQTEAFVIPAFAMQIARIEAGQIEPVLRVGNLDAERDFLDVRDVARAYALTVQRSDSLEPGLILNVASGIPRRIGDLLLKLLTQSTVPITIEHDPERRRPSDLPRIIGDATRARELLGWRPEYTLDDTLRAVLDDCRRRAARD